MQMWVEKMNTYWHEDHFVYLHMSVLATKHPQKNPHYLNVVKLPSVLSKIIELHKARLYSVG